MSTEKRSVSLKKQELLVQVNHELPNDAVWLRFLPSIVRKRIGGRHGMQEIIGNSGWLFADRLFRFGLGLFISAWMARYLGPEGFGVWSFALAFTALFSAFAGLGLDSIIVRELLNHPERHSELLGTAFVLKLGGGLVTLSIMMMAIMMVRPQDPLTHWLVALAGTGFIFQSLNVIDAHFQAKLKSRNTVYAANVAFLIASTFKVYLLLRQAPLIAFAAIGVVESLLSAGFLVAFYRLGPNAISAWKWSRTAALGLLKDSWPLIFAGVSVMIYMRIDQIMIGQMLGNSELGLYSAAVRISEVWYFVPTAVGISVFPAIAASRKKSLEVYHHELQRLFSVLIWLGICMATVLTFFSGFALKILFGPSYAEAAPALALHAWAGVFVGLGVASGIWFTIENLATYALYRTLCGCLANVLLNLVLIPRFGMNGAALATVLSQILATLIFDVSNSRTRPLFWMKVKAFNPFSVFSKLHGN